VKWAESEIWNGNIHYYSSMAAGLCLWVNWPRHEANHSTSCTAEINNELN